MSPRKRRARFMKGRAGLFAEPCVRRGVRQSGSDRRVRGRRRRSGDRPAGDGLAFQQISQPGHRRRGAADPASQRLQDRQSHDPGPHRRERAGRSCCEGYGWISRISSKGDEPTTMHQLMAATLDQGDRARFKQIQSRRADRRDARHGPRWPMIVLRTPKGWTGPKVVDGQPGRRDIPRAPGAAVGSVRRIRSI